MAGSLLSRVLPTSIGGILLTLPLLFLGYILSLYIYNVFFHPLARFPGPKLAAATPLVLISKAFKGEVIFWITEQHQKYGQVIRVAPNELSFSGADAYKDIYGHKKAGQPTPYKAPEFYGSPGGGHDIVNADYENHARMRRIFSNAFSDRALKLQEPLFVTYVDKLVRKIKEGLAKDPKQKYNMVQMYNFTTFDIMGDLTFGEPLQMLDDSSYHPWVAAMFAGFKYGVYIHSIRYFPGLENLLLKYCIPESIRSKMKLHKEFSIQRVNRRLEKQDARPDIWGLVLGRDEKSGLTRDEMYTNANLFMIAGTETTATLLSGLTYHLLSSPAKLAKLTHELRTAFPSESQITIEALQSLKYLNACIEEGLRMYPPVAQGLPRIAPAPMTIDGQEVPAGTKCFVTNLAANRDAENWRNAYDFVPERWLGEENPQAKLYAGDKRHGFQPFSTGPRACLGKNMAYHEMRLILTKVLWNFDLEICEESQRWNEQKIFIMWDKPALFCRLRERQI